MGENEEGFLSTNYSNGHEEGNLSTEGMEITDITLASNSRAN